MAEKKRKEKSWYKEKIEKRNQKILPCYVTYEDNNISFITKIQTYRNFYIEKLEKKVVTKLEVK